MGTQHLRIPRRLLPWVVLLSLWPVAFLLGVAYLIYSHHPLWAVAMFYLLPPLFCRTWLFVFGNPEGRHDLWSRAGLVWWGTTQFQMVFNRVGAFEELLRLVPLMYSVWLRLWGAKIGRNVFWSPRVWIMDRPFLRVGENAVFGGGFVATAHLILPVSGSGFELVVAKVTVGENSLLGGYGGMTPGSTVAAGETLPGTMFLAPFFTWSGKRKQPPLSGPL